MTEAQKHIREYLAQIGKRGGRASRRELSKSHARQMIAIREMKRAALRGDDLGHLAIANFPSLPDLVSPNRS